MFCVEIGIFLGNVDEEPQKNVMIWTLYSTGENVLPVLEKRAEVVRSGREVGMS